MKQVSDTDVRDAMRHLASGHGDVPLGVILSIDHDNHCTGICITGDDIDNATRAAVVMFATLQPSHRIVYGFAPDFAPVWKRRINPRHRKKVDKPASR